MKLLLCVSLALTVLGTVSVTARRAASPVRRARSLSSPGDGLEQILVASDGQPEDIGYGYQRAAARTTRPAFQGLLLLDKSGWQDNGEPEAPSSFRDRGLHLKRTLADDDDEAVSGGAVTSAFRERLASRQRRQRGQRMQQQQQQQQHWNNWRRDNNLNVNSFYPAGPSDPVDNPERYLQALREAWARYQQQTGTIDVGPDDLTDLETLQFLEALGEDFPRPSNRKRSVPAAPSAQQAAGPASAAPRSASGPGGATPWDWSAPLAWSGYQLRKRSATPDFQDESGDWSEEAASDDDVPDDDDDDLDDDDAVGAAGGAGGSGSRLAMLLTQQLFDERYNDPAVKRLLLSKRSLPQQQNGLPPGHAMKRRKKSTLTTDPKVQKDLAHIFGEPESEPEPPRALPLASAATTAASATAATATAAAATASTAKTTAVPNTTAKKDDANGQRVPLNPIGHAQETDKLAREHQGHVTASTSSPNVQVHVHEEHAPPMVAAEGPHSHDQATHAEEKGKKEKEGTAEVPATPHEEPRALGLHHGVSKKSIDWSQYFGIDRRRKKSTSLNDVEQADMVDADWLLRHSLIAFAKSPKPSNINKRVAVKKEGASPDALLLGAWGARRRGEAWDADDGDGDDAPGEDGDGLDGDAGRCPAVTRLAEDCRGAVGSNDALLPLCVLYQACHLCGAAMGVPVGESCETELGRRGADLCAGRSSSGSEPDSDCQGAVEAIVEVYRTRHAADNETCTKQPCLAHFFLTAPAVAFER